MRRLAIVLVTMLLCLPAIRLEAQTNTALFPKLTLTAGGYSGTFSSNLQLNAHSLEDGGTDIDVERDLGMDTDKSMGRFVVAWRPFTRHEFEFGYFDSRRSASKIIERDIIFGDTTFPVHAEVSGQLNVKFWEINYTYWLQQSERNGVGLNGGLAGMTIKTELVAENLDDGNTVAAERRSTDLPVPVFGVVDRFAITEKLIANGRLTALPKLSLGDYTAYCLVAHGSLEYRVFGGLGIGAAYNYLTLEATVEKDRFNGDFDYTVQGPEVFVRYAF